MAGKKKGGLGKGLDAIFAENDMEDANATVTLKISEIEPNRAQPRKDFNDEALAELADSIAQHGVLQPLLVRPLLGGGYQIVAGERRWRAARMAGVSEVPVVIREMSDHEVMELALIENLQREDLTPLEEAQGYQSLIDQYGMTQEEISRTVGKSRPAVANALRLLHLPEDLRRWSPPGSFPRAMPARCSAFRTKGRCARRRSWLWSRVYRCASWKSL
ncbi:MAG: ParB/RepB/Spo0J family partition protein [Anaeromassilibacillus sp.]